jgi:predicted  nucleic acid-binding Zn-ribbon protein
MKYFCSKCGKTTQYSFELPKFCAFCGQSFLNKSSSIEAEENRTKFLNELKLKKNINSRNIEDDILYNAEYNPTDQDSNEYKINNFKNIKPSFKLNIYKNQGESFGSLIDNPHKPMDIDENINHNVAKTKQEILEEFKKEAGSLREKE